MTNESEGPAWTIMTSKSKKGDARHTILNTACNSKPIMVHVTQASSLVMKCISN